MIRRRRRDVARAEMAHRNGKRVCRLPVPVCHVPLPYRQLSGVETSWLYRAVLN